MRQLFMLALLILSLTACTTMDSQNKSTPATKTGQSAAGDPSTEITSSNKLDLSNQWLIQISQAVFKMTNLQELNVSSNQLTGALPAEIRQLQKLEVLNVANNQMTGVPAEVGQLVNLRVLNLANNQLTGLPYELGNLKKLQILNLSGNKYSTHDLEIIRQGLPANVQIIL